MRQSLIAVFVAASALAACGSIDGPVPEPTLTLVSGDGQEVVTGGTPYPVWEITEDSLVVRATTASGAPLAGASVYWSSDAGSPSSASTVTDADGRTAVLWRSYSPNGYAGVGPHTVRASMGTQDATFAVTALVGAQIQSIAVSPGAVDVQADSAVVTVALHVTDDRATKVNYVAIVFYSPNAATDPAWTALAPGITLTSGTAADGVWSGRMTVPKGSKPGAWSLGRIFLDRNCGCGFSNKIELLQQTIDQLHLTTYLNVTAPPA